MLFLDIETSPFISWHYARWDVNIGMKQVIKRPEMMSFAATWLDEKDVYFASINDIGKEEMLLLLHELESEADVLVWYNGDNFDDKHINREFSLLGLNPPTPYLKLDLLKTMRKSFKFPSNKLDDILQEYGLGGKAFHYGDDGYRFMLGDEKVYNRFKKYNIADVTKLKALYKRVLPWISNHPNLNLDNPDGCPRCGAGLTKQGTVPVAGSRYPRFKCRNGHWSRGVRRVEGSVVKAV